MGFGSVLCRAQEGIHAPEVAVEVYYGGGLPAMHIVGLPETAVKESRDRVRAALETSDYRLPRSKVTVSLAPADLPKEGGRYDLAIAIGLLVAQRRLPQRSVDDVVFLGELGLAGDLRPVRGALPVALACARAGQTLVVTAENAPEAALAEGCTVLAAGHLVDVCRHLAAGRGLARARPLARGPGRRGPDLAEVRGQHVARRALEIAASGGHNLLFFGPPGSGKTMLASRLPGLLPPMTEEEAQESAAVASVGGRFDPAQWRIRPFRAPHHSASSVALAGGGSYPRPGEISLAHNGVLFLDELPEFSRHVLEILREPLESGAITIARAARRATYPSRFQLVAAMNPCPCGYRGDDGDRCQCSPSEIERYQRRVSGPLLDRIDLHVEVPRLPPAQLRSGPRPEGTEAVRRRVAATRERQLARQGLLNARLGSDAVTRQVPLRPREAALLETACERLGLSARAYHRILKLARTIADLEAVPQVTARHLTEAIQYRRLDRRPVPA